MQKVGGSWQIQQHLWATLNGIGGAAGVTGQAALWGTLRKQKAALREGMLGGGGGGAGKRASWAPFLWRWCGKTSRDGRPQWLLFPFCCNFCYHCKKIYKSF